MYSILIFLLTIILITLAVIRFRTPPFFVLIGGALFFGAASGMPLDQMIREVTAGMGRVFALLGILAGVAGFLLAIPLMCCITAFVILTPILNSLGSSLQKTKGLLYTAALGSLISFALIYPSPVIIALIASLPAMAVSPVIFDMYMLPIAIVLLAGAIFLIHRRFSWPDLDEQKDPAPIVHISSGSHLRAWYPLLAIGGALVIGLAIFRLSPSSLIQVVMLTGVVTALVLAPGDVRKTAFTSGAKHAGVIIFDLCGAGALGAVIVASNLGTQAYGMLTLALPAILVPFLIAALIQTAQGSRVVTAVITGEIIAGTSIAGSIHPIPLILLISGGACIVSYITDPYFWLVQRATGDDVATVVKNYTIPLAAMGFVLFFVAAGMEQLLV